MWKTGESGNKAGRPKGAKGLKTLAKEYDAVAAKAAAAKTEAEANGATFDLLAFLSTVARDGGLNVAVRIQAAGMALPFLYAKKTARIIGNAIKLPQPKSVEEATANISKIATLAAAGKVGLDEANDLVGLQKSYIEAKIGVDTETQLAQLKQALRNHPNLAFDLTVVGGLGPLPGTAIDMPPRKLSVAADRGAFDGDTGERDP